MSKYSNLLILISILILAASLRLYGLDRQSIWYDELVEEQDFQIILKNIFYKNYLKTPDIRPPLNPFFVYLATKVSPGSDFALRIPSVIFGLISVPLLFLLGKRLFNEKVGLIASFLLAISPFHIWYSQDARMYALQWMLSIISLIYFIRAVDEPCRKNFILYFISTEAALYTHQFSVFLVVLQWLYLLISLRRVKAQFLKWSGVFVLLVILYLPWLIYSLTTLMSKAPGAFLKPIDLKIFSYTIYSYCAGFSIGPSLHELHFDSSWLIIKLYLIEIGFLMFAYCSMFALGLFSLRKKFSKLLLPLLLLTVPFIGVIIIVIVKPDIAYNVRYTATALLAFLLFVAKGVDWLTCLKSRIFGRILAITAIVVMTGFSAYSYANYQFNKKYHKADFRSAAAYIIEKRMPNDAVMCLIDSGVTNRYARGSFQCEYFRVNTLDDKLKLDIAMRQIVEGRKQLWLVLANEWYIDNIGNVKDWLDNNYEEIKYLHRGGNEIANINIYTYDLTKKKLRKQDNDGS